MYGRVEHNEECFVAGGAAGREVYSTGFSLFKGEGIAGTCRHVTAFTAGFRSALIEQHSNKRKVI